MLLRLSFKTTVTNITIHTHEGEHNHDVPTARTYSDGPSAGEWTLKD